MASYIEITEAATSQPNPFQRTGKFPLDRTSMFASLEDAQKYAAGNRRDPDTRKLYTKSYVGQILTVYENGVVSIYKINEDKSLTRIDKNFVEYITVNGGEALPMSGGTVDIEIPASPVTGVASGDTILSLTDGLLNSTLGMSIDPTFDQEGKRWLRLTGVSGTEVAKVDVTEFITLNYVKDVTWDSATTTISATKVVNGTEQPAFTIDLSDFLTRDDFDTNIFDTTGNVITIKADVYADYQDVEDIKAEIEQMKSDLTALTETVDALSDTVNDLSDTVDALSDFVSDVAVDVQTISGTVDSHTTDIQNLQSDVQGINDDIQDINDNIELINGDIEDINVALQDKAEKSEIKTYIENTNPDFDGVVIEETATANTFTVGITGIDAGTY